METREVGWRFSGLPAHPVRHFRGTVGSWVVGGSWMTHLQHVQQRRLSGIVEAEEQQLGVLVEQAE